MNIAKGKQALHEASNGRNSTAYLKTAEGLIKHWQGEELMMRTIMQKCKENPSQIMYSKAVH